jgi:hypothetical protein
MLQEELSNELTQKEYWVKAVVRFAEFLPASGPAARKVSLSPPR